MSTKLMERNFITQFNNVVEIPTDLHMEGEVQEGEIFGMTIMSKDHGDFPLAWNPKNPVQVAFAKGMFESMIAEGMTAYKVTKAETKCGECGTEKKGAEDKKDEIKEFDPNLGENEIYLFMPMTAKVGG